MARIRPYTAQVDAPGAIATRGATEGDIGGPGLSNLGQSTQSLGMGMARAQAITNREEEEALAKADQLKRQSSAIAVQKLLSDYQFQGLQAEEARQKTANGAYPDAHVDEAISFGKQQQDAAINAIIEDPKSPILPADYEKVRAGIAQDANRVSFVASQWAAKAFAVHEADQVQSIYTTQQNIVRASPIALFDGIRKIEDVMAGVTFGSQEAHSKAGLHMRQGLIGSAMDGHVDAVAKLHDPNAIAAMRTRLTIPNDIWQKDSSPADYARALDRLDTLEAHELAQRDLLAEAAFNERRDEAKAGVLNNFNPEMESAFDKNAARRELRIKDGNTANFIGQTVRTMGKLSFNEQVAELMKGQTAIDQPGDHAKDVEAQTARLHVWNQRIQAIKNDLAGEVLKSEPVATAYAQMKADDPRSVDAYVRANQAETQRIAPRREPRLLSNAHAGQIASQLGQIDTDPRGADQALQIISAERTRWGAHWPTVLKQLTQDEVLTGNQAVAARMGQDPVLLPDAKRLLTIGAMKPDEINHQLPTGSRGDVQKHLVTAMQPVAEALLGQVGGEKEMARYRTAAETLALAYLLPGGGESSPEKAAEKALNRVIKDSFHWQDGYHAPKQYDPSAIRQGARAEQLAASGYTGDASLVDMGPHDASTFGARPDGTTKGLGYFGALKRPDGKISTELTSEWTVDGKNIAMPLIVPTLTRKELDYLLQDKAGQPEIMQSIADKAFAHGMERIRAGKSPYASAGEQKLPPGQGGTIMPPRDLRDMRQADVDMAVRDAVQSSTHWKGNRDGTGLDLLWSTGEQVLVQQPDGTVQPYSRTYEQLSRSGARPSGMAPQTGVTKVPDAQ